MENANQKTLQYEVVHINKEINIGNRLQPIHLGDVIVCLNLLYNRQIITNCPIKVLGPTWIADLFEIFDYGKVYYGGDYDYEITMNVSFMDLFPRINCGALVGNKANCGFMDCNCFCNLSNPKIVKYDKIHLPNSKIERKKNNKGFFQFDSRSLQDFKNKSQIPEDQCVKFINYFKKDNEIFGIGGKETHKYLNYEFLLGDLKQITTYLMGSNLFLGVDSGISHLAGTLKIPSEIICLFDTEPRISEIIQMYNLLYPNTKIYNKFVFFKEDRCNSLLL